MPALVILVVDDEPPVLRIMERILKTAGHCVYTCSDAVCALELAALLGPELDLLICDVLLHETSGFAVARDVSALCPHARTILVSGDFLPDRPPTLEIGDLRCHVLCKPFNREELLKTIKHLVPKNTAT